MESCAFAAKKVKFFYKKRYAKCNITKLWLKLEGCLKRIKHGD